MSTKESLTKAGVFTLGFVAGISFAHRFKEEIDVARRNPRFKINPNPIYPSEHLGYIDIDITFKELMQSEASQLLTNSLHKGQINGEDYKYIQPSEKYVQYWHWDSAHAAVAASYINPEIAKNILTTQAAIFDLYNGHGPQIVYLNHTGKLLERLLFQYLRGEASDQLTQTPLFGLALEVYAKETGDMDTVKKLLSSFCKHYEHIKNTRCVNADINLPVTIHPYEALDSQPSTDLMYKRSLKDRKIFTALTLGTLRNAKRHNFDAFEITQNGEYSKYDITFCSFYIRSLFSLSYLWEQLGDIKNAEYWKQEGEKALTSLVTNCFDEEDGFFYSRRANRGKELLKVDTVGGLFPLMNKLPSNISEALVSRLMLKSRFLQEDYFIPSVFQDETDFYQDKPEPLWRGPGTAVNDFYVLLGLYENGFTSLAQDVWKAQQKRFIERSLSGCPFPEFYSPKNTYNSGYVWSALSVCDPQSIAGSMR